MSLVIDIANAVVTALNTGPFSQTFTAERRYVPRLDLKELSDLHMTVVPKGVQRERTGRDLVQCDVDIDIAVQKKVVVSDTSEADGLMTLTEELVEYLTASPLPGLSEVAFLKAGNEPIFSSEHLDQVHGFTSLVTVTYRTLRSAS